MSERQLYPVSDQWSENAWINKEKYEDMYQESVESPDSFWEKQAAEFLDWNVKWEQVHSADFSKGHSSWFLGGKLNVTANCIDRHLDKGCLLYTSPSPRDMRRSRMPSSA